MPIEKKLVNAIARNINDLLRLAVFDKTPNQEQIAPILQEILELGVQVQTIPGAEVKDSAVRILVQAAHLQIEEQLG